MRLLQWLVYITNLYVIFGIFVLIWLLYGEYIIQAWEHFSGEAEANLIYYRIAMDRRKSLR